jgi:hypothetical protein
MIGWLEKLLAGKSDNWRTEMADGRVVFYPLGTLLPKYGIAKNGYVLPSMHDSLKLRAWFMLWWILWIVLWTPLWNAAGYYVPNWGFALYAVWFAAYAVGLVSGCVFYWIWMRIALRGLPRSTFIWPPR